MFIAKGLAENRKINLVGDPENISQALRLLRFTLMGPTRKELDLWQTNDELKEEWLAVSEYLVRGQGGDGSKEKAVVGAEYGWRPYAYSNPVGLVAETSCGLIKLKAQTYLDLLNSVPQRNYQTRRRIAAENPEAVDWLLGEVPIYQA